MKTLFRSAVIVLTLAGGACGAVGATVITFDEFVYTLLTPYSRIPNGYQELNWNNFYAFNPYVYQYPTDYTGGVISPSNIAFNGGGQPATISGPWQFDLISAYLTSHDARPLHLTVEAFAGATLAYSGDYYLYPNSPQNIYFGYAGIDHVTFTATSQWYGHTHAANFIMDNLVVSVPEPGISGWLVFGMLGLRRVCRKRRDSAIDPSVVH